MLIKLDRPAHKINIEIMEKRGRKVKPFLLVDGEIEPCFEFQQPQKLNKCKYELISFGSVRCSIVTERLNREDVLKRLIKLGFEIAVPKHDEGEYKKSFKIWVTENGITELLICSRIHKRFIKFLLG